MYNEVSLHQDGEWVVIAWTILSLFLFLVFLFIKKRDKLLSATFKVFAFFVVFICAGIQFWIFRFGMGVVYTFFSFFPRDSEYLRFSALFFCAAYLYLLPTKTGRNKK